VIETYLVDFAKYTVFYLCRSTNVDIACRTLIGQADTAIL